MFSRRTRIGFSLAIDGVPMDASIQALMHKYLTNDLDDVESARLLACLEEDPELVGRLYELQYMEARLFDLFTEPEPPSLESATEAIPNETDVENADFERLARYLQLQCGERYPVRLPVARDDDSESIGSRMFDWVKKRFVKSEPSPRKQRRPVTARKEEKHSFAHLLIVLGICFTFFAWAIYHEFKGGAAKPETHSARSVLENCYGKISAVSGARTPEDALPLATERHFENEKIVLESGVVELSLKNGVRLVLEGPAEFQFSSPLKSFCTRGRVSAEVPPSGHGFEIATPQMTIRDLGTAFVVDVAEQGSQTHVVKGEVETQWLTREKLVVSEGRGIAVVKQEPVHQIAADPSLFVTREHMRERALDHAGRQCRRWAEMFRADAADPTLLLQLDFDRHQGKPVGAAIVRGRWDGMNAACFRNVNDRIEAVVDGSFKTLTLTAAIRVDDLARPCNTILATNGFIDRSGFCWNVERSGRLQFHFMEHGSKSSQKYESRPCLSPKLLGTWLDVAVTVDANRGEIVHYMNGTPVETLAIPKETSIRLGDVTVGNWVRKGRAPLGRQLEGAIDAISVFSRVLSPEEMRERRFEH